jgi:alpha-aminoadipate carrier protein LysW
MATICPECDNLLDVDEDEVEEGDTITCDECGADLEIISTDPLQIVPVDAEGYDDEDDDYKLPATDDEEDD